MRRILSILLLISLLAAGCKSRKKHANQKPRDFEPATFSNTKSPDSLLRKNWEYFSGRLAVDFSSEEQDLSGNISLRMRKDSIIWFSVSASIGLQVAKGIITKDSVKILDLYEKRYFKYGIKELGQMLGAEVGLRDLQNMILGNPVFDTAQYKHDLTTGGWFGTRAPLTNVLFAKYFSQPDSSYITQSGNMKQLKANYYGTKSAGSFSVAEKMLLLGMGDKKTVRMDIEFTTANDAYIPSYPFSVPADYTHQN